MTGEGRGRSCRVTIFPGCGQLVMDGVRDAVHTVCMYVCMCECVCLHLHTCLCLAQNGAERSDDVGDGEGDGPRRPWCLLRFLQSGFFVLSWHAYCMVSWRHGRKGGRAGPSLLWVDGGGRMLNRVRCCDWATRSVSDWGSKGKGFRNRGTGSRFLCCN
ncbi:hypothetical protein BU24DRAFT_58714 [Aaosphaeria arxii CBS 175.79]|uniref:Uncharacterized protein n=1 Tax=Aaosphaeria arxii CBS 175.79 TaxID=1450172 RepID=A0A6A5XCA7_9PLEO|nr:uncharacterized protein BU24DRAFT_58714 [Aaosphaeria arxii CBS 175.79]KAF2010456.1 hypothetical protein BU24DRAFT_58714 [Aaosphaeria arxii CBS 175.79]